ncbi:hypothetical protein ABBQ38_012733 [Trebouxia sp. C0009 RCD-2024]
MQTFQRCRTVCVWVPIRSETSHRSNQSHCSFIPIGASCFAACMSGFNTVMHRSSQSAVAVTSSTPPAYKEAVS